MAQTVKLRRSATSGAIPTTSQLALGELALNTYDGKVYMKKSVGGTETIVEVGAGTGLSSSFILYEYTATSGQTSFSGSDQNSNTLAYDTGTPPKIQVFLNGILLDYTTDYTATNGTSVTLTNGATVNDLVQIAAYKSYATVTSINLQDNQKLTFGDSNDLELFHNGTRSIINDAGTGDLQFQIGGSAIFDVTTDGIVLNNLDVEANEFIGDLRGAVLFKAQAGEALSKGDVVYISGISGNTTVVSKADADDAAKMPAFGVAAAAATLNSAVDIYTSGILSGLDTSSYSEGDELFVSTTAGALTNTAPTGETALLQKIAKVTRSDNSAGSIFITGAGRTNAVPNLDQDQFFLGNASNQAVAVDFSDAVEALSINNVVEDTTPQLGGDLASNGNNILFADNDKAIFGTGSDLQIYHNGTDSVIENLTGDLYLTNKADDKDIIFRSDDGSGGFTDYLRIDGSATTIVPFKDMTFGDSVKATFGVGSDLQIYHDGSNSYVKENGTGQLIVNATNFYLRNSGNTNDYLTAVDGGAVRLLYANAEKLATTSTGINVTGTVTGDGLVVDGLSTLSSNNNATPLSIVRASATSDQTGISFNAGGNTRYIGKGTDDEPYWATSANLTAGSKIVTSGNFTGILDSTYYQSGDDISVGNITATGYLRGPSTFTIDPATHGDDTGTVVIAGNLQVDGTTTTINSTTLTVDDKLITLASGAANAAAADGAGIEVDITGSTNPSITYDGTNDQWDFNKPIESTRVNTNTVNNVGNSANIIYRSSTNTIVGNNASALVVQDGGNVGIGTDSPNQGSSGSQHSVLTVKGSGTLGNGILELIQKGTTGNNQTLGDIKFFDDTNYNVGIEAIRSTSTDSGYIIFKTRPATGSLTERVRITESGDVGIGVTDPDQKLDVNGNIRIPNAGKIVFGSAGASPGDYLELNDVGSSGDLLKLVQDSTTRLAVQGVTGNVSVGVTTPFTVGGTAKLSLSTNTNVYLTAGASNSDLIYSRRLSSGHYQTQTYLSNNTGSLELQPYGGKVGIGTSGTVSATFQVEEYGIDTTETSTTATTQVAIHTFASATFRSARFTVQVTNSTDSTYHLTEILLIHDGTTPSITEYGTIFTGSAAEATFDADINTGNVRLLATPASTDSMEFKVVSHSITV